MRTKFKIGDRVKAAHVFHDPYFRFNGMRIITDTGHNYGHFGYTLDGGKEDIMYYPQDLQLFCGGISNKCLSCQHRFRCYTVK